MNKYALLSVSDKTNLKLIALALLRWGYILLSTGGTAKALREMGIAVTDVGAHTGFPEMLDGRVKILHPKIFGGILYIRGNDAHQTVVAEHGIGPIDFVIGNLYPFEQTVANPHCTVPDAVGNIDIGGPSGLRAAAKNHESVTVVVDPADYEAVAEELDSNNGATTPALRVRLARKVFRKTSEYDLAIANWMDEHGPELVDAAA
ncbi:MAG: Bifunctional purine biosynthesis protein PurH [Parcubacteria group bacterium GW2011_GWA2_49_9]|nr:MAG: Bifunctional purine biosynthesis protein PurH [Parcubacteria group bacterium GW2011_GWA2_49_9]